MAVTFFFDTFFVETFFAAFFLDGALRATFFFDAFFFAGLFLLVFFLLIFFLLIFFLLIFLLATGFFFATFFLLNFLRATAFFLLVFFFEDFFATDFFRATDFFLVDVFFLLTLRLFTGAFLRLDVLREAAFLAAIGNPCRSGKGGNYTLMTATWKPQWQLFWVILRLRVTGGFQAGSGADQKLSNPAFDGEFRQQIGALKRTRPVNPDIVLLSKLHYTTAI